MAIENGALIAELPMQDGCFLWQNKNLLYSNNGAVI